jgi:hypothetical protein
MEIFECVGKRLDKTEIKWKNSVYYNFDRNLVMSFILSSN